MITKKEIQEIREELLNCHRPLFFFDDDPDGLASFLLLYRFVKEGKGVIIKGTPQLDEKFLRKIEEYGPDIVFILDKPLVQEEFVDKLKVKTIWIDHHEPVEHIGKIKYYNPRKNNPQDNRPTSYWCHKIVEQDLWIAMVGIVGDWYCPSSMEQFKKEYPDLMRLRTKDPARIIYESKLGELIRVFSFSLKGTVKDSMKSAIILTRINSPYEILKGESEAGKFIYRKYNNTKKEYGLLLESALKQKKKDKILLFEYTAGNTSFTQDLSNELLYRAPKKLIIVARKKSGDYKCSLRYTKPLHDALKRALNGIEGYGGGHEHACGASISEDDFERFIQQLRSEIE